MQLEQMVMDEVNQTELKEKISEQAALEREMNYNLKVSFASTIIAPAIILPFFFLFSILPFPLGLMVIPLALTFNIIPLSFKYLYIGKRKRLCAKYNVTNKQLKELINLGKERIKNIALKEKEIKKAEREIKKENKIKNKILKQAALKSSFNGTEVERKVLTESQGKILLQVEEINSNIEKLKSNINALKYNSLILQKKDNALNEKIKELGIKIPNNIMVESNQNEINENVIDNISDEEINPLQIKMNI